MAFAGPGINHVNLVFSTTTRWLFALVLLAHSILTNRLTAGLRGWFGFFLALNIAWCLATTAWSEVPLLTGPKAVAFALWRYASAAQDIGGRKGERDEPFSWFFPPFC